MTGQHDMCLHHGESPGGPLHANRSQWDCIKIGDSPCPVHQVNNGLRSSSTGRSARDRDYISSLPGSPIEKIIPRLLLLLLLLLTITITIVYSILK